MALTLFETTYLSTADADQLNSNNLFWTAASTAEKEEALSQATSTLNENRWLGVASSSTQPLAWPRKAFSFYDEALNCYVQVEEGTVPRRLAVATANLAMHFIQFPSATSNFEPTFDRIKLGPLEVEDTSSSAKIPRVPYAGVGRLVSPLLFEPIGSATWWRSN